MLWRKQPSRSPPRLTSSIPEMEHYVAAMDTPIPESPVDKVDIFATTPADLPAAPPGAQEQTAAPASSSDDKAVSDMTEPQGTTPKDDAKTSTIAHEKSGILRSKTIRVKAQRSRPRLLTLIACVSYLLFHLMGIDIGLRTIQGYTEPRLHHAEVQLTNTVEALAVDYLLDIQLTNLLDTTLDRRYMETSYEDCLARGLHKANHVFRGFDFTSNPSIRNQTADWVTTNCRRLLYTPQVHSLRASMLRTRADDIRHALEEVLKLVRQRLALLQCRLKGGNLRLAAKPVIMDSANNTNKRPRMLPDMPYGFGLECKDQSRCHLVYSGPTTSSKGRKTLKDAVADARKEVHKWSWKFEKVYRVIDYLHSPLAILQPLLIIFYLLATLVNLRRRQPSEPKMSFAAKHARAWNRICYIVAHLQHDERHTVGLIINTALYALLSFQLKYIIVEFDRVLLPVGLGFCVFHFVQATAFIDVESADESLHHVVRAVKELYLIAQGSEVLPESKSAKRSSSTPRKPTSSPATKPASKIATRFISPLTPISEDLQRERKAMHAEQGKEPCDDVEPQYGYATETDSEYDSDVQHSSYVDLTGGATPTVSEGEDDLVVVEG